MKIRGNTVGTPMKRPDFNQTDPRKSDYIRNNPIPSISKADEGKILQVQNGKLILTEFEGEQYTKGLEYELSYDGKYYICKGIGTATEKDVVVASKINGLPVEVVGSRAFVNSGITSIVIPESVEWISDGSLACDTLKTVKIYANLTQSSEQMGGAPSNNYGGATFIGAFENYEVNSNGAAILESITQNTSVKNIYVWWEEGYIDYAPWGATNATVHYSSPNSKTIERRVSTLEAKVENLIQGGGGGGAAELALLNLINEGGLE